MRKGWERVGSGERGAIRRSIVEEEMLNSGVLDKCKCILQGEDVYFKKIESVMKKRGLDLSAEGLPGY